MEVTGWRPSHGQTLEAVLAMRLLRSILKVFSNPQPVSAPLPKRARTIFAEWIIKEGGFQVAAWTDETGSPFLAIKTLNGIGKTTGIYDWHQGRSFTSDMVAGFNKGRPLIVRLLAEVTAEGLSLTIRLPPNSKLEFKEKRFTPWNSGEPAMSMTLVPTFDHYAVKSFPTDNIEGELT